VSPNPQKPNGTNCQWVHICNQVPLVRGDENVDPNYRNDAYLRTRIITLTTTTTKTTTTTTTTTTATTTTKTTTTTTTSTTMRATSTSPKTTITNIELTTCFFEYVCF